MSKYEDAIIRYEDARQAVAKLDKQRKELVENCLVETVTKVGEKAILKNGDNCFTRAWVEHERLNNLHVGTDSYDYEECFFNVINNEDGACDNCRKAQEIKRGSLADAKKEFGNAKRSLSKYGRMLIQERTHTVKD